MAKIVQVCNTNFYLNKFLKPLVLGLVESGHEVTCITGSGLLDKEFAEAGVKIIEFSYPQSASFRQFLSSIREMKKILQTGEYDLVNSHNRNSSIVARVASWLAKVPLNVYTAHGMYFHDDQGFVGKWITIFIEVLLSKITHFTLSQSQEDVDFMVQKGFIDASKIRHIGNGINIEKFHPSKKKNSSSDSFKIMAVGRLVRGKGFEDLIYTFSEFKKLKSTAQLTLVGGTIANDIDPAAKEILQLIEDLRLTDSIEVTGIVNNVEEYLAHGDVFVHPSYREGVPRSLLEAMCIGLIPIATSIRGAREIIKVGTNGYLFKPKRRAELLQNLLIVEALSEEGREALSCKVSSLVMDQYAEVDYTQRQIRLLEEVLSSMKASDLQAA